MPPRHSSRLAALLAGVGILAAAANAEAAGTLTFCLEASPEGFDMAQYETTGTFDAVGITIYDQLAELKPGSTEIVPALAESWQVSSDGLQYTFKLRAGVKFHSTAWFKPTRDFNADDVLFSFRRMMDKTHWAHDAARNGFVYWEGMNMNALVKSVEKIDALTVRFTLTRPEPFIADLAVPPLGSILSAEYAESLRPGNKLDQLNIQPIGTGPFALRSYQKDAVIRYTPNAAYFGGAPKIDQLVMAVTTDYDVALQRFKAGECLVAPIKNTSAAPFVNDRNVTLLQNMPLHTIYVAPNHARAPMKDKRFREALNTSIDRAALVRAAYGGGARPALSFLPAEMWSHDGTLKERHDLEHARALVKASGYDGHELTLFVNDEGVARRAAEFVQSDWAQIGVKVRIVSVELGELYRRTGKGEHDLVLLRWGSDNADPDNFLSPNLACTAVAGGGNKSRYCSPAFDALLDGARRSTDTVKRTAFYTQAQKLLYEDSVVFPLVYPVRSTLVSKRVEGYLPSPLELHDFRTVSVK
ncbi:ABC transporter substrate-binding protein [soil metagenome]